jgi:hypothetical protein
MKVAIFRLLTKKPPGKPNPDFSQEVSKLAALEAFRTEVSFRFFDWLTHNREVFAAYKASLGIVWA